MTSIINYMIAVCRRMVVCGLEPDGSRMVVDREDWLYYVLVGG